MPSTRFLIFWTAMITLGWDCRADDFSTQGRFVARLSTSITLVQDGKPFRDAIDTLAERAGVNVWLDRKVDPTSPVSLGALGPTVSAAFRQLAESRDCVMMPVAGVVLIGRAAWVDATSTTLFSIRTNRQSSALADIDWPKLTTPQMALVRTVGDANAKVSPPLAHDLWPAVRWKNIDRRVAVSLILAQFDLRPASSDSISSLRSQPASATGNVKRRYFGVPKELIEDALRKADRDVEIRTRNGWVDATGSAASHRAATNAMLAKLVPDQPDPMSDDRPFSLKPTKTAAGNLFQTFAQSSNRKLVIEPDAVAACKQVIEFEADNQTIAEMVKQVAQTAGVNARLEADQIVITAKAGAPGTGQ